MLFVLVILTFAACLFGVVAIEVSMRNCEERERSSGSARRVRRGGAVAFEGGLKPEAPSSSERGSRAA